MVNQNKGFASFLKEKIRQVITSSRHNHDYSASGMFDQEDIDLEEGDFEGDENLPE